MDLAEKLIAKALKAETKLVRVATKHLLETLDTPEREGNPHQADMLLGARRTSTVHLAVGRLQLLAALGAPGYEGEQPNPGIPDDYVPPKPAPVAEEPAVETETTETEPVEAEVETETPLEDGESFRGTDDEPAGDESESDL